MKKHYIAAILSLGIIFNAIAADTIFDPASNLYLGTSTPGGSEYIAPTFYIKGAIQFQCIDAGPSWGSGVAGVACRNTGETVQTQALLFRAKSYHFETLTSTGIKSGFILDENSNGWIGQDFKSGNFAILDRLEVDGAMAVGTGFTGSNSTVHAPANGLAVQGDLAVGTKAVTAYGGGSRNLVVQSGANANIQIVQGSGSGIGLLQMNSASLEISTQTDHQIRLAPGGTTRVYLNTDGSLRIPAYSNCTLKTDASGNVYCG